MTMKAIFLAVATLFAATAMASDPPAEQYDPACINTATNHIRACAFAVWSTYPKATKGSTEYQFGEDVCVLAGQIALDACQDGSAQKKYAPEIKKDPCTAYGQWVSDTVTLAWNYTISKSPGLPPKLKEDSTKWAGIAQKFTVKACIEASGSLM